MPTGKLVLLDAGAVRPPVYPVRSSLLSFTAFPAMVNLA